jgi:hypothetical protein
MSNVHQQATATQRYWVLGGKYETMDFDRLVAGTECVFGPFESMQDAQGIWRDVTEKTRCQATVRYTIAAEPTPTSPVS